ncbi:NAD-dependent epimerase/dehydratase [Belliella sp. DSM 111904]|uniref:NAD-dependent epimerase/dehydratase n=1 Tax=Belliella filtrata TaxID=2923435 RepID=A0ABS9UZT3_9BACT|nr:NAD-dependent epimerase/dehydratase [Belliella filtrata]MCH7409681.1 NAD-dependent epimerase/dehydratase [Belliella filtrata]
MNKKTILLTGATGFLGSHLLEALIKEEYTVVVLKRSSSNNWRIKNLEGRYISYDIDLYPIEKAFQDQKVDCVIHTACNYGRNGESIWQVVDSNLMFGLRILDFCLKFDVNTFINTDTLLQKHINVYSLSKKQFVEWLEKKSDKIKVVNLRLEHMYGPNDDTTKFVPWIISQFQQGVEEIKLTEGEQERDFIYIDDVVSAYLTVLNKDSKLQMFNEFDVGSGQLNTVKSFLEELKDRYQTNFGKIETKLAFGSIPYREGEMMKVEVNIKKLLNLGWSPMINLEQGITNIIKQEK